MATTRSAWPASVVMSYAAFVLTGVGAGVGGVLIPAQIRDYDIDMATIGLTFVTFAAGFFLAGTSTGALIGRLGMRMALLAGGICFLAAALVTATRPSFVALVAVQVLAGFGVGVLESALNVYLSGLPSATALLNRLHGFFGVGALLGPLLAAWMLRFTAWTSVWLVLALVTVPLMIGFAVLLPPHDAGPVGATERRPLREGGLGRVLRQPAVMLAGVFLTVYVGLEASTGNWAFTYLVVEKGQAALAAGYGVSAYWLGLTAGRFVISPLADRWGLSPGRMMQLCMVGVVAATAVAWAAPGPVVGGGLALLGFFLGPLFPTAMALVPTMTTAELVPTAIGVINALSVVGAAGLPWLAGAIAEGIGIWALLPYVVLLGLLQVAVWEAAVRRATTSSAAVGATG